jgi:hypothetical protein
MDHIPKTTVEELRADWQNGQMENPTHDDSSLILRTMIILVISLPSSMTVIQQKSHAANKGRSLHNPQVANLTHVSYPSGIHHSKFCDEGGTIFDKV